MQKIIKDPFMTTTRLPKDPASIKVALRKIEDKIITYGICSDAEQAYLNQYCFGKTDQKNAFTAA